MPALKAMILKAHVLKGLQHLRSVLVAILLLVFCTVAGWTKEFATGTVVAN